MRSCILIAVIFVLSAKYVHGQHLFPERFEGCVTDRFALEKDTTQAKIEDELLVKTITSAFDEKTRQKISGTLTLQIIVDTDGKSCLISAKNETNVRTKKLNLKETIDGHLVWDNPKEKVAAVVVFRFANDGISFKRLGVGASGVHELQN
jgi:hypothetical protein